MKLQSGFISHLHVLNGTLPTNVFSQYNSLSTLKSEKKRKIMRLSAYSTKIILRNENGPNNTSNITKHRKSWKNLKQRIAKKDIFLHLGY